MHRPELLPHATEFPRITGADRVLIKISVKRLLGAHILASGTFSRLLAVFACCAYLGNVGAVFAQDGLPKTARIDRTVQNNVTQEHHYDQNQVFIKRVETSFEGETQVVRQYNSANQLLQVDRVASSTDPLDGTKGRREISTKKYEAGSGRPYKTTTITETDGLLNISERVLTERITKTRTFDKKDPSKQLNVVTKEI